MNEFGKIRNSLHYTTGEAKLLTILCNVKQLQINITYIIRYFFTQRILQFIRKLCVNSILYWLVQVGIHLNIAILSIKHRMTNISLLMENHRPLVPNMQTILLRSGNNIFVVYMLTTQLAGTIIIYP